MKEWARQHPWGWTGICAGALFGAVVVVFRLTLDRELGKDVVMAALMGLLFWGMSGAALSAYARRHGD